MSGEGIVRRIIRYYIENDDDASKQWFMMLQLLASAQVPDSTPGLGPMLTLPVSGRR